jgi:sortase A
VSFTTIRVTVGRVVLVAGILVLLFIPYLLWGTGLVTAHNQAQLRAQFAQDKRQAGVSISASHLSDPTSGAESPPQVAPRIPDPPIGHAVGVITIPTIDLSMVVVEGTGDAQLQMGPGHYTNTPLPGEAGNSAIAGHRTTYLHPFYSLNDLVPGDGITVETVQGIFLYHVTQSLTVSPSDVSVIDQTTSPTLTLTTCTPPFTASQRLVVHAALVASILAHPKAVPVATSTTVDPVGHDWLPAILWGLGVAALTTLVWVLERRTHRGRKIAVVVTGLVVWVVVVFFFFQSVAPLLPASY